MANDIKYLDQKGLKTFHDATGWVTIKLDKGQSIKHHTYSPVKFHSNGKVYINGVQKTIVPIAEEMLWPDTIIKNGGTPMTISVFVNEYNQLIQDDFKTDKLTLPGNDEQVVLGNGSLKELNNLVVGNAENAEKVKTRIQRGPIYLLGTSDSLYEDYNTILKNSNCYIEADGLTLKVPKLSITEGGLSITEGVAGNVLQGNGQPISKMDLEVGSATNAIKSNQLYISKITSSIPAGVQQSKTYNFFLSGFKDNSAGYKDFKGFDGILVRVTESNGNISENELVVPSLSIEDGGLSIIEGTTSDVLQGNGQPIAKSDLINELLKILLSNGNEEIIATSNDIEEIFNITNNNTNI